MDTRIQLFDPKVNQVLDILLDTNITQFNSFAEAIFAAQSNNCREILLSKKSMAYLYDVYYCADFCEQYLIKKSQSEDKNIISFTLVENPAYGMQLTEQFGSLRLRISNSDGIRIFTGKLKGNSLVSFKEETEDDLKRG